MTRNLLLTIFCTTVLIGCVTVQMPELSQSHPAHPEAEDVSVFERPSILQLREEPLVVPPLPIPSEGKGIVPPQDQHREHSTTGIDVASAMYVCPMHEEVKSDSPDSCSKCGMDLVKKGGA